MQPGLKPTVRALKGVGFNRALPAPFGFDAGFTGDGVNDEIRFPGWVGKNLPSSFTIEFWIRMSRTQSNAEMGILSMQGTDGSYNNIEIANSNTLRIRNTGSGTGTLAIAPTLGQNLLHHVVLRASGANWACNVNGIGNANSIALSATRSGTLLWNSETVISAMSLGKCSFGQTLIQPVDEFRIYNRQIDNAEIVANYNGGVGENPQNVLGLVTWLKFSQIETLDFSALQDNSDLRLGVRDISNNNNHGQVINCDTNPASGTYCLRTF
jgi:hypothetical protein